MSVEKHTQLKEKGGIYFFTTRIYKCEIFFITKEYIDILLHAFRHAEIKRNIKTLIRTIMPNHIHWIFKLPSNEDNPIPIYQHFNRHTAKEILKSLEAELKGKNYKVIKPFINNQKCQGKKTRDLKRILCIEPYTSKHKIWKEKPDLKLLYTDDFIRTKVNYVYENPIREPWNLVEDPKDYPFTYVDWDLINEFLI